MELVKIRFPNNSYSWTIVENGESVKVLRDWIIHLEDINFSPNTIGVYTC